MLCQLCARVQSAKAPVTLELSQLCIRSKLVSQRLSILSLLKLAQNYSKSEGSSEESCSSVSALIQGLGVEPVCGSDSGRDRAVPGGESTVSLPQALRHLPLLQNKPHPRKLDRRVSN